MIGSKHLVNALCLLMHLSEKWQFTFSVFCLLVKWIWSRGGNSSLEPQLSSHMWLLAKVHKSDTLGTQNTRWYYLYCEDIIIIRKMFPLQIIQPLLEHVQVFIHYVLLSLVLTNLQRDASHLSSLSTFWQSTLWKTAFNVSSSKKTMSWCLFW